MDIQKTVLSLLDTGLTQKQLAVLVPCSPALIQKFSDGTRGSRPSFAIATSLAKLHIDMCVKRRKTSVAT
jgi:hypothetical protein